MQLSSPKGYTTALRTNESLNKTVLVLDLTYSVIADSVLERAFAAAIGNFWSISALKSTYLIINIIVIKQ